MRILTASLLIATLTVSACGGARESRLNPFNWFGRGQSEPVAEQQTKAEANPLIPQEERGGLFRSLRRQDVEYAGAPIDQVSSLVIERVPGGAIIRATGIASFVGAYDVRLVPANEEEEAEDGVLTYRLEAVRPLDAPVAGSDRLRTVTVARRVTDSQLAEARIIRVEGARNAQTSSRR